MKKLFYILIVLAASLNVQAQNSFLKAFTVYGDTAYKLYPGYHYFEGVAYSSFYPEHIFLIKTHRVTMSNGTVPYQDYLAFMKIDTSGNVITEVNYYLGSEVNHEITAGKYNIDIDSNGDILIASSWESSVSGNDGLYLWVDSDGNIQKSMIYGSWDSGQTGDDAGITAIKSLPTGQNGEEVYIAGGMSVSANSSGCNSPFVAKIDKQSGLVKWWYELNQITCGTFRGIHLYPTQELGLWTSDAYPYFTALARLDTAGNLLYMPKGYAFSGTEYLYNVNVLFASNNYHIFAGTYYNSNYPAIDSSLVLFASDMNHNIVWSKKIRFQNKVDFDQGGHPLTLMEASDGMMYLAAGHGTHQQSRNGIILIKFNPNDGTILFVRDMGANLPDKDFVLNGVERMLEINNSLYFFGDEFILKTDMNGNWGDDCNDNRSVSYTEEPAPAITTANLASSSDITYGIGTVSLNTDSVLLFEESVYNGIPVANITVTPNPACEYSSVTITDNSQNANSYKLRIFDWS
ncbi:MAG: hypothetical protein D6707_06430, partial [Bacteroidetes bacterium]